jgi:hypothetical protein
VASNDLLGVVMILPGAKSLQALVPSFIALSTRNENESSRFGVLARYPASIHLARRTGCTNSKPRE